MSGSSAPLNAALARRLAEAADGLRDGKFYYFVCKANYPFDLHTAQGDTDEEAGAAADSLKSTLGNNYNKYGSYQTQPDTTQQWDYDQVNLSFIKNNNTIYSVVLGRDVDAILLSLSAYDKFFEPYYTRLYGADVASTFRTNVVDTFNSTVIKPPPTHPGITILMLGSDYQF